MNRSLRLLLIALLCAAGFWTLVLMTHEGAWAAGWATMSAMRRIMVVTLSILTLSPYALLTVAVWRPALEGRRLALVAAIALATAGAGVFAIGQALFVSHGDQRGLIFLFVPPIQLAGAMLAFVLSLGGARLGTSRSAERETEVR